MNRSAATLNWTNAQRHRLLALLCLVGLFNFIDRQIITILLVPIKAEFDVSDAQLGLLTGLLFAGTYALASIPLAALSDRFSRKRVLAGCLSVWSAMTTLGGLASTFLMLAVTRVGVAVAEAGAVPTAHSLISDLYPAGRRGTAIAIFSSAQSIGIGASVLLGGLLVGSVGWRMTLVAVGVPGLVLALVLLLTREPKRGMSDACVPTERGDTGKTVSMIGLLRLPGYAWLCAMMAATGFCGFSVLAWGPTFLNRVHAMPLPLVGATFGGAVAASLVIGNLAGGTIADSRAKRGLENYAQVAGVGITLAVLPGLGFVFAPTPALAVVALFFFQFFLTLHLPSAYALGQTLAPADSRAMSSVLLGLSSSGIGGGLGPLFVGKLSDLSATSFGNGSLRVGLLCSFAAALPAIACAAMAYRNIKKSTQVKGLGA